MSGKKKTEEDIDKSQDISEDVIGILREENEKLKKQLEGSASKELTKSVLEGAHAQMRKIADSAGNLMREASEGCASIVALLEKLNAAKISTKPISTKFSRDFSKEGYTLLEDVEPRISSVSGLKLLSFLKRGESCVLGEVMKKRAEEQKANFGQKDAEWLLEHQNEIPKEFRQYYLAFPGTVWQFSSGCRCVVCLYWLGGKWCLGLSWLDDGGCSGSRLLSVGKF